MHALGIDIGGTGIKAAPIDLDTGTFVSDRVKIATPQPAAPDAVAGVVEKLVTAFSWSGPIGVTFPGVVINGVTRTAANLDKAWIGLDARSLLSKAAGQEVRLLNDADAAGIAEMTFGAGKYEPGTVHMVTFGTGIGSALFVDGVLVPNTEFGHLEIRGKDAEERSSERAKTAQDMSWKHWARNVNEYLEHIEALLSPQLIIVGGGISRQSDKFLPLLTGLHARVVPAAMAAHPGSAAPVRAGAGANANPSLDAAIGASGRTDTLGDQGRQGFPDPGLPE